MVRLDQVIDRQLQDGAQQAIWWRGDWLSRRELARLAQINETRLSDAGFGRGHRLAVLVPNCPGFLALALAVWRLGGTIVPLNHRAGSEVLLPTLDLVDPFMIVHGEGDEKVEALLSDRPVGSIALDGSLLIRSCKIDTERSDSDLAVIFATSGTTGLPKAVPLTHGNLMDNVTQSWSVLRLTEEDRILWVLPNFHSFGLTLGGLMGLVNGARQVIVPQFMPPLETLKACTQGEVSILLLVPAMVEFLKRVVQKGGPRPTTVRMALTGGDRLNLSLDQAARESFGVPLLEGYGTTECSPVVAVNRSYESRKLGTIGQVLPGYLWEVRDDSGVSLAPGQDGILWVKGPSVFQGYYKAPEITAERMSDGWYNTGDVVRYDEDGYITVLDRVTDVIIVGGFNVYPQEVERVLSHHPAVAQVAVIAMAHPVQGQIGRAFVVLNEGASPTTRELISFCKGKLAHYKIPRRFDFVEELPLSPSGKILRRELRTYD
ncbi:MAG: long-chain fatty acid--CoA ligase [Dethiosulfovibrio peptidovorans]|nr:MAG: long-chain fatty acid--CoA ligase [Dethiosulfovibrio peptidovorans]